MQAKVYFVKMTDEMYNEINREGWSCEAGRRYHAAKDPEFAKEFGVTVTLDDYEFVGQVEAEEAEEIWMKLQNCTPWTNHEPHEFDNRSMDVGDLIVWQDDLRVDRVASCGFETVDMEV